MDPHAWLKDVLERLPEHPINQVAQLLPFNWKPLKPPETPTTLAAPGPG